MKGKKFFKIKVSVFQWQKIKSHSVLNDADLSQLLSVNFFYFANGVILRKMYKLTIIAKAN